MLLLTFHTELGRFPPANQETRGTEYNGCFPTHTAFGCARLLGLQSSTRGPQRVPTPAPTPRHAPHSRTTPRGAFPVELFAVGISPNAGRVTDRYGKLSCRNSLGSRRIGDHEGLPPADGIRASGPGAHPRMRPLTRFETNEPLNGGLSISLRDGRFPRKHLATGAQQPRDSVGMKTPPQHVSRNVSASPSFVQNARAELHCARHWIETTDYSHPSASRIQHEPHWFEEDYS